ncbi:MAG: hypothetical protein J6R99_02735 [Alphaproteobacteria bacterium]|nr:hypothetical protein [Alphaproteobacteria bacterium]MBO7066601.1 hypothetical protein [Alphaproteobacteria bacterium]
MQVILALLAGTGVGVFTAVIAGWFPNQASIVWWMGGAICMIITTAMIG